MGCIETGNARRQKAWGQIGGRLRKKLQRQQRRRPPPKRYPKRRRPPPKRYPKRRQQRGQGLFSSIGSGTVDRVARHVEGITPGLIDIAATRFTRAGKELTDNAINQLIDIPKNRLKGALSDIERKIVEVKNRAIGGIIGKLLPKRIN